ncbi:FG-GAP-like repeat-containing protein [Streptomyces ipomoeae]|uniref:FG-GAP repeat protein n=1 Tax=Streptomyces ipomoeae 91-03 TaxID=698759 RepID=L1KTM5_9ACTN|nr:FG-GAP-like repeat-containing protein [Streptomyces ipomoeae]EKX63780.1 FG-GAP repeat protein [Streptomyces ipomoeae 91-03]MDX2694008.1 FG-GAP-like repeat-containing protein [Streptomyces ipomoeae]MDX2844113.1 FG-GAP-like repeat-containing protein [Streptomyces ipomoeae]
MSRAPRAIRRRISTALLAVPLAASAVLTGGSGSASAAPGSVPVADDFNGDGYADLVVGAPNATVSGKTRAGYVAVLYGSSKGLSTAKKKLVSRSTSGIPGSATANQRFGASFAKADLDRDGYGDLVIAGGAAGSVILWGSASGLTGGTGIGYGAAPQAGDFDGDGKTDLALFSAQNVGGDDPSGAPAALWKGPIKRDGKPTAVLPLLDKSLWWGWYEEDASCATGHGCENGPSSITGPVVSGEVGDFNGDGRDDIVQWVYTGDGTWGNRLLMGGGATGFTRGSAPGDTTGGDAGTGIGDVNGDGYDDLVVGADDWSEKARIAYGSAAGLTEENIQTFDQDLPGFPGAQEEGDRVGSAVSVADVTGDGYADVALGIEGEDVGSITDAGSVALLHGSASGLTGAGAQVFHQNTAGVPGVAEENDEFGATTALLDVNGDGHRDLAAASTAENASNGAVWLLRGTASDLTTKSALAFGPKDLSAPYTNALFGHFLR